MYPDHQTDYHGPKTSGGCRAHLQATISVLSDWRSYGLHSVVPRLELHPDRPPWVPGYNMNILLADPRWHYVHNPAMPYKEPKPRHKQPRPIPTHRPLLHRRYNRQILMKWYVPPHCRCQTDDEPTSGSLPVSSRRTQIPARKVYHAESGNQIHAKNYHPYNWPHTSLPGFRRE